MRIHRVAQCAALALVSMTAPAWAAVNVVLPNANTSVEGDTDNIYPFTATAIVRAQRYQQVYAASQFPVGVSLITQLRFRPDTIFGSPGTMSLDNIQIAFSVTAATPATLSATYDNNLGPVVTTVYNGPLQLSTAYSGPPTGPKDFDIVINLMTPFLYNSAQGNLLMEVRNSSHISGDFLTFDAVDANNAVQRVYNFDSDPNPSHGFLGDSIFGVVTQFVLTPVTQCVAGFDLISTVNGPRTQQNLTYRAHYVNNGPGLAAATATASSLDPFAVRVAPGQDTLNFSPVPANSLVTSSNTFMVIVDSTVPWDFNKIQWSCKAGPAAPVANPGQDRTVAVGTNVTLDGTASTNPSGTGVLTYFWRFTSRPPGTATRLVFQDTPTAMFTADVPGTYVLSLTVSNGTSSSTTSVTITAQ